MRLTRPRLFTALAAAAAAGYAALVRPRLNTWGVSDEEAAMPLPGDDIVSAPRYETNHAVTIYTQAAVVWPWLMQLGQGRGGFYSYDRLENLLGLEIHSADRIIPELQRLQVGDAVRLAPEDNFNDLYYEVAGIEPRQALILATPGPPAVNFSKRLPYGSWTFALIPAGDEATRLIARTRMDFGPGLANRLTNKYALEPIHFIMERRMLLGIKRRAESSVVSGGGGEEVYPEGAAPAAA
jgi:hypothetical protein